ncbi:hypothetical protein SAY87_026669 [Trapa incisa]|uniref:Uncharacterized protein n=1 Tax=Trapa incisa TaxID=236973 RepID=A0AAN7GZT4_9MYRT|nr:hypothetical protein SAY87_026669 [Trapa incisa]
MSGEPKDLAIKLFGKTIPLLEVPPEAASVRRKQSHEVELTLEVTVRADEDDRQEDKFVPRGSLTLLSLIYAHNFSMGARVGDQVEPCI